MKFYDNLSTDQIIELRHIGGYLLETENGSNTVWSSPNNEYKFVISRKPNELWSTNTSYMVIIEIYDILGINITKIVTTEFGIIELICDLLYFTDPNYFEYQPYSSYTISFDPTPDLSEQCVFVQRINSDISDSDYDDIYNGNTEKYSPIKFSKKYEEFREIIFEVNKYYMGREATLVKFNISDTELVLFCFVLFFSVLIDIDIPPKYMSEIEYITQRFTQ